MCRGDSGVLTINFGPGGYPRFPRPCPPTPGSVFANQTSFAHLQEPWDFLRCCVLRILSNKRTSQYGTPTRRLTAGKAPYLRKTSAKISVSPACGVVGVGALRLLVYLGGGGVYVSGKRNRSHTQTHDKNNTTNGWCACWRLVCGIVVVGALRLLVYLRGGRLGLCKIVFHFEAHVHESIIVYCPPPPALPTLL